MVAACFASVNSSATSTTAPSVLVPRFDAQN